MLLSYYLMNLNVPLASLYFTFMKTMIYIVNIVLRHLIIWVLEISLMLGYVHRNCYLWLLVFQLDLLGLEYPLLLLIEESLSMFSYMMFFTWILCASWCSCAISIENLFLYYPRFYHLKWSRIISFFFCWGLLDWCLQQSMVSLW